jgi:hypothetical protein
MERMALSFTAVVWSTECSESVLHRAWLRDGIVILIVWLVCNKGQYSDYIKAPQSKNVHL